MKISMLAKKKKSTKDKIQIPQKNFRKFKLTVFFVPIIIITIILAIKIFVSPIYLPAPGARIRRTSAPRRPHRATPPEAALRASGARASAR